MRRGPKPAKAKVEGKAPVTRKSPKKDGYRVRDLEKRLAETLGQLQTRDRQLAEAREQLTESLEQQTATAEVLGIISRSPADAQPVFDAIARNAVTLCSGITALVLRFDGEMLRLAGHHAMSPEGVKRNERAFPRRPARDFPTGRAFLDGSVIHVPDLQAATEFIASTARQAGAGSLLCVPLLREHEAIGVIGVTRDIVGPFSSEQIEVLQTFAAQAVIAIENARLFNETKEALEQQTATSEILRVISQSPTDVQPVFDAIVASAVRLCGGVFGTLATFDGQLLRLAATHNWTPRAHDVAGPTSPTHPSRALLSGRAILERTVVHVPDVERDAEYQHELRGAIGFRSGLAVPMLRDDVPLGVIGVGRTEPGPFSESQIALLKAFADQAVIAIENVRLFKELQEKNQALTAAHAQVTEALEQQTATSEILRVISSSPTDEQPVFDAIARSTVRLCEGARSTVWRPEGDLFRAVARCEMTPEGHIVSAPRGEALDADSLPGRAIRERQILRVNDVPENPTVPPQYRERARIRGYRSLMAVPMVREGLAVGVITVVRPASVEFSDQQVGLVKTFADQAVIAIENVRLFTELQTSNRELTTALDQQTATSEILRTIAQTKTDPQPVFDTIVQSAVRLLGGVRVR
jgi:two-component system, NtrC family, sensor kinase